MKNSILQLFDIGAFKFGDFLLKSGIRSPIYIDLRESISFPLLLKNIADEMWKHISDKPFDRLCGVPYTALPIASYLSIAHNKPMVMRRKEAKEHGTKKIIEGVFEPHQKCLIIEDLITSGTSILETAAPLEAVGMQVEDVVVFLDREQGGRAHLKSKGYALHAVITLSEVLAILVEHGRIDRSIQRSVLEFTKGTVHAS